MSSGEEHHNANMPMAHTFYFRLSDTSKELKNEFIDICVKCLSGFPGQTHFSVGYRALHIDRDVSAKDFQVSVNMIFSDNEAYAKYTTDSRHQEFITLTAGMSISRIVYDSFLHVLIETPSTHNLKS